MRNLASMPWEPELPSATAPDDHGGPCWKAHSTAIYVSHNRTFPSSSLELTSLLDHTFPQTPS
jgi:hypothetical protein